MVALPLEPALKLLCEDGRVVRKASEATPESMVDVRLAKGRLRARVTESSE